MEETVRQTELPRQRHSDHSDRLTKTHRGVPSGDAQMLLKEQRSKNSEIKFAEKNSRREKRITDTKNIAKDLQILIVVPFSLGGGITGDFYFIFFCTFFLVFSTFFVVNTYYS